MAQILHKSEINNSEFRKCGEISALFLKDKKEFYLNCEFCEFTFLQLNNFIQHIYEEHLSELPSIFFKQETPTTAVCSQDRLEYCDFENTVGESGIANFVSNDFETVILDTNDADIKEEFPQDTKNEENIHTKQNGIHNDDEDENEDEDEDEDDDTIDSDKMTSDSEIAQSIEKSHRRKTQQKINIGIETNDVDETTKAAFDKKQSISKPRARNIKITDAILNDPQCITLAGIYKEYTCLWDENDIAYRFKNRRDEALRSVRECFNNKTGLNLTEYDFQREILRLRKICSYEKKKKIKCKQNKLEHKASCTYYDYIEFLEVDVSPFECSICGESYPVLGRLKVHVASHDGSSPFKCHICGRGFHVGNYLTIHLRRHAQDHPYQCEVCNKTCATPTEKKLHMRTHTGEKPFVCYICGAKFISSSNLIGHTMRHEKNRCYKCETCFKAFYTPETLKEHKKTHLKVCDYICDVCDKGFKSAKLLRQHKHIHDSEKRYVCKICGNRFAQAAGLYGHMKSHDIILNTNTENHLK